MASAILVASLIATKVAYNSIVRSEVARFTYQEDFLTVGDHSFVVNAQGLCIGEISFSLRKDKATFGKAQGKISAQVLNKPIDVHIDGNFYFNPLGQMSDFFFSLASDDLQGSITTSSIHPIKIEAQTKINGELKKFEREIPGPIVIEEINTGKFQIRYDQDMPVSPIALKAPAMFLQSELKLGIFQKSPQLNCTNPGRIDLTSLVSKITGSKPSDKANIL